MSKYGLRETAMLVKFSTKRLGNNRKDKEATAKIEALYDVDPGLAGVYKKLVDPKTPIVKKINKHLDLCGNTFRPLTGVWDDEWRIITAKAHPRLQSVMQDLETIHLENVEELVKLWPAILANAQVQMKGLYDASLLPTVEEIRNKFIFNFQSQCLPDDGGHLLLQLDEKRAKAIGDAAAKNTKQRLANLTESLHERVRTDLTEMVKNMREYGDEIKGSKRGRSFKDSQIEKMRDLADLLPALNLEGDARLDKLGSEIAAHLTTISAADLRGNKRKGDNRSKEQIEADAASRREAAADKTDELLDNLDNIFGEGDNAD